MRMLSKILSAYSSQKRTMYYLSSSWIDRINLVPDLRWNVSLATQFLGGTEDKESKADYSLIAFDWHIQNLCFVARKAQFLHQWFMASFYFGDKRRVPCPIMSGVVSLKTKRKMCSGLPHPVRQQSIKADLNSYNNEKCDQICGDTGKWVLQV